MHLQKCLTFGVDIKRGPYYIYILRTISSRYIFADFLSTELIMLVKVLLKKIYFYNFWNNHNFLTW